MWSGRRVNRVAHEVEGAQQQDALKLRQQRFVLLARHPVAFEERGHRRVVRLALRQLLLQQLHEVVVRHDVRESRPPVEQVDAPRVVNNRVLQREVAVVHAEAELARPQLLEDRAHARRLLPRQHAEPQQLVPLVQTLDVVIDVPQPAAARVAAREVGQVNAEPVDLDRVNRPRVLAELAPDARRRRTPEARRPPRPRRTTRSCTPRRQPRRPRKLPAPARRPRAPPRCTRLPSRAASARKARRTTARRFFRRRLRPRRPD